MSAAETLYLVAYDIRDPLRWRAVFKLMNGYGQWLQLSLFQCRLCARRHAELRARLGETIAMEADHVLIVDLGPAHTAQPRFESLGKPFDPIERAAVVV
jgi:CRISPR-associated protein Cas2